MCMRKIAHGVRVGVSDKYNRPDEAIKAQLPAFLHSDIYGLTAYV